MENVTEFLEEAGGLLLFALALFLSLEGIRLLEAINLSVAVQPSFNIIL